MNIVIANISTFLDTSRKDEKGEKLKNEKGEIKYDEIKSRKYAVKVNGCSVETVDAVQTNESIIKVIANLKEIQESGGVGKIIMLVSYRARNSKENYFKKTAYDYYIEKATEACGKVPIFCTIDIEDNAQSPKPNEFIFSKICGEIEDTDTVYIDSAGGARTISNLIQLLSKILLYKGIKNPLNLYSNIQNGSYIEDTSEFTRMTNLADALNEFMTSGKADQLIKYSEELKNKNKYLYNLLESMRDFSDKIRLGDIDSLDITVQKLQEQLSNVNTSDSSSIESVIINQFVPYIKQNLLGDMENSEHVHYLQILDWCVKNSLIQQALTIFVEKMPVLLFNKGIIKNTENENVISQRMKAAPIFYSDWRVYAFYSEVIEPVPHHNLIINKLRNPSETKIDKITKSLYNYFNKLKNTWPEVPGNLPRRIKNCLKTNKEIKKIIQQSENYQSFLDEICRSRNRLLYLLLLETLKEVYRNRNLQNRIKTNERKFLGIDIIENGEFDNPNYSILIDKKTFAKACYGYIYVKSVRNRTNHASSEDNLTEQQQCFLKNYGYDFTDYNLETVKKNLKIAIKAFKDCSDEIKGVQSEESKQQGINNEESFVQTTLKKGDCVQAKCDDEEKKVKIDNYDDFIPLIGTKGIDPSEYLGKTINVIVQQTSNDGRITQVKLILEEPTS